MGKILDVYLFSNLKKKNFNYALSPTNFNLCVETDKIQLSITELRQKYFIHITLTWPVLSNIRSKKITQHT